MTEENRMILTMALTREIKRYKEIEKEFEQKAMKVSAANAQRHIQKIEALRADIRGNREI